ncbi:MAG: DUF4399 domain-containing protein [Nitrospirota bacterium]|nr:DUF4399 domain-containing protein [Nitrospirota bacterium]
MNFFKLWSFVGVLFLASVFVPQANAGTPSPEGAELYIISPKDGETVSKSVTIRFGLKGMGVAPAGTDKAKTGHHHLMLDGKKLPPMDQPMSKEVVKHFGGGQTEVTLSLSPGKHTLQLILGDKAHVPHDPPVVSKSITITVK